MSACGKLDLPREDFEDVRKMHLQTVLILVYRLRHPFELAGLVEFGCRLAVNGQAAEWRTIMGAAAQSSLGEVVVVRWTEEEDSFATTASVSCGPC
jgi:hypothetical protein